MKCFYYFKDKSRGRERRSAPQLKEQGKSDTSGADRVTKSSCSVSSTRSIPELYEEKAHNLRVFSYSELRQATNNFNRLLKIGEGGFGNVYKGSINPAEGKGDPIMVAIKKLNTDGLQVWDLTLFECFLRMFVFLLEQMMWYILLMRENSADCWVHAQYKWLNALYNNVEILLTWFY
jgi:hypothetical protein